MLQDYALTTLKTTLLNLGLYSFNSVTSIETLSQTVTAVYSLINTDIAINTLGAVREKTGTAYDTINSSLYEIDYELGTLTFTASLTGSVTVSSYSYYVYDHSKDYFVEKQINSVSLNVQNYCNRMFNADTYDEFYKGTGSQKLLINQYPINVITSIKSDSALLTAGSDYITSDRTYLDEGIIFKSLGWYFYGYLTGLVGELTGAESNIEVVYSAGYTTIPTDIEDAVLSIISENYNIQKSGTNGLKQLTEGGLTYIWDKSSISQKYPVLDMYKRW